MALTRKLLKELELNEVIIERIIAAHAETVDGLRTESARHEHEAQQLRSEFDAYRLEIHNERTAAQRKESLREALSRAGANEQALDLLSLAVTTTENDWDGPRLKDESLTLHPVKAQYAAFFSQPSPIPTDPVAPPLDTSTLTMEDVRRMSSGEINRNWSAICAALMQRD
nr:hypothetical protein [Clostridia bacterium]